MTKKNILRIVGFTVLAVAILFGANFLVEKGKLPQPNEVNDKASSTYGQNKAPSDTSNPLAQGFSLTDLNGNLVSLNEFRGKYVLLNFWATWCPPCQQEMPDIQRFSDNHEDELVVLAVNLNEETNTVKDFISKNNYTFPVLLDSYGQVGNSYKISSIPASYFIDKEGRITKKHVGSMTYLQMENYLKKMSGK